MGFHPEVHIANQFVFGMNKVVVSIVTAVLVGLLGILGWTVFKGDGPRERVSDESGNKVLVEELSYYDHGRKVFGKVFKPGDENGNYPDSLGSRPLLVFIHEPLKTAEPEKLLGSMVPKGFIGFSAALHGNGKKIADLVRKAGRERFVNDELIFLISDSYSAETVIAAAHRLKEDISGVILFRPSLEEKTLKSVPKLSYDVLSLDSGISSSAIPAIFEYLELKGALK